MPLNKLNWLNIAITLAISNGLFAVIMAWSLPHLSSLANNKTMFDARPMGYTLAEAQAIIQALGQQGREFYLSTQLWLDMFYPTLFAISFAMLIAKFCQMLNMSFTWQTTLITPAFLTAIFDYAENFYIHKMLTEASILTETLVQNANFFTIAKSLASSVTQITALVLLILIIIQKIRKPHHAKV